MKKCLAAMLLLFATAAHAGTPAGGVPGCNIGACNLATSECCSQARQQKAACEEADRANMTTYKQIGKDGVRVHNADQACAICSGKYIAKYCKGN